MTDPVDGVELTPREIAVMQLVSNGRSSKQIAYELQIKQATVETFVRHATEKLGAANRTHAVVKAMRRGYF